MEVKCPNCRYKFEAAPSEDGAPVNCVCPRCGSRFTLNAPAPAQPAAGKESVAAPALAPAVPQPEPAPQPQPAPAPQPQPQAEPQIVYVNRPDSKNNMLLYVLAGVVAALLIICGFLLFNNKSSSEIPEQPIVEQPTYSPPSTETPSIASTQATEAPAEEAPEEYSTDGYYTLEGELANRTIRMSIRIDGTEAYGSYIYVGISQVDIDLYGTLEGNRLVLAETNEYGEHSGDFIGYLESGVYSGTFHRYRNGRNDKNFDFYLR
ncbi:MAG: hypothetical protein IJV05_08465 [Muribaculaceae bacterium]|nr:hypothetical protein [Muribaculaceae bacterium]